MRCTSRSFPDPKADLVDKDGMGGGSGGGLSGLGGGRYEMIGTYTRDIVLERCLIYMCSTQYNH